jgi:hypothetical protein
MDWSYNCHWVPSGSGEVAVTRSFDWMSRQAVQMLATCGEPGSTTVMSLGPPSARDAGVKLKVSWVEDFRVVPCCPPTSVPETKTFAPVLNPEPVKVMVFETPAEMVLGLTEVTGAPGVVIS